MVYAALEEHCKVKYASQPGRFAKLLLRLPALRSIGLKCVEHLFFKQVGRDAEIGKWNGFWGFYLKKFLIEILF